MLCHTHNHTILQRRHILNLKISKCHQRNKCHRTWTLFSKTTALVDYYYFLLSLKIEISLSHHGHSMLHQSSKNLILKIFFFENHSIEDVCCHNCTLWLKKVFFELDCHFYEEFLLPQLKLLTHILNLKFVPKRLA